MQRFVHSKIVFVLAVFFVIGLLTGCSTKKDLDEKVDKLIEALREGNRDALSEISDASLVAEINDQTLAKFQKLIQKLGAYNERTMTGIEVKNANRAGKYKLKFNAGTVDLELTALNGKLVQFNFTGDPVKKALLEIQQEQYARFEVRSFNFVDADGKPNTRGAVYRSGETVYFRMEVQGLTRQGDGCEARIRLQVISANNQLLLDQPDFINQRFALRPDDPLLITVRGNVSIPNPGTYTFLFEVLDVPGNHKLNYQQSVTMQ